MPGGGTKSHKTAEIQSTKNAQKAYVIHDGAKAETDRRYRKAAQSVERESLV